MKKEKVTHAFYIAGVRYHRLQEVEDVIKEGTILSLVPEPDNPYDSNAVQIIYIDEEGSTYMIGYVPSKFSSEVLAKIEAGRDIACVVARMDPKAKPWEKCYVEIRQKEDDFNYGEEEKSIHC